MKAGDKVYYSSKNGKKENGRIKSIQGNHAFVVYHCNNNWDDYMNYTGASTNLLDLHEGWVNKDGSIMEEYCDHYFILTNAKWQSEYQKKCQYCGKTID